MALFREEGRLSTPNPAFDNPAFRYVSYAIAVLLISILQLLFLPLIAVGNITPNLLLIFTVVIALLEGQLVGLIAAFGAGLVYDAVSGDVPGTNALASILAVFVAGYFYRENRARATIGSYRFLLIILLSGFIYNGVYFLLYIQPSVSDFTWFFLTLVIASTLYTTVVSVIPMLILARKSEF